MPLGKGLGSLIPQVSRKIIRRETGVVDAQSRIWQIPISEIVANPEQPRQHFAHEELEELIASIRKHGILQPIIVSERNDGGYELIVGERRLRASQIAGLENIPAIVRSATQQEKLELALIENIQRQNLNPIEEAFAYRRLLDEFNLTQEQVAEQIGKSRPTVANLVRLLTLPEAVQKAIADGKISVGQAKALLSLKSEKELLEVFDSMRGKQLSVRAVAQSVARRGPLARKGSVRRDPNLTAAEKLLEERLGSKVHISQRGERGKIEIEFYSSEEFKRLLGELT